MGADAECGEQVKTVPELLAFLLVVLLRMHMRCDSHFYPLDLVGGSQRERLGTRGPS